MSPPAVYVYICTSTGFVTEHFVGNLNAGERRTAPVEHTWVSKTPHHLTLLKTQIV